MDKLPEKPWAWYDDVFGVFVPNTHGEKRDTPKKEPAKENTYGMDETPAL